MENSRIRSKTKTPRLFLSYSFEDRHVADGILREIEKSPLQVQYKSVEFGPQDSVIRSVENVSPGDYLIVLLSPTSVQSHWVKSELNRTLAQELTSRDITLIPAIIRSCKIPRTLATYGPVDLRRELDSPKKLIDRIIHLPTVDFDKLDYRSFENLIVDLLGDLGFRRIQQSVKAGDRTFDITAQFYGTDPFGKKVEETWVVEVKLYRHSRADFVSARDFAFYLVNLPHRAKGLLVTNSQLTSVTKNWLASTADSRGEQITIIEGPELRRLLLGRRGIIEKYFGKKMDMKDE